MDALIARFTEASTYSGLGAIAVAVGQGFPQIAHWANGAAVVFGAFAMFIREGSQSPPALMKASPPKTPGGA